MMNRLSNLLAALVLLLVTAWLSFHMSRSGGLAQMIGWPSWSLQIAQLGLWAVAVWSTLFIVFCLGRMRFVDFDTRRQPTPPEAYAEVGLGALPPSASGDQLYLDLLKRSITNVLYEDTPLFFYGADKRPQVARIFSLKRRVLGEDSPTQALTMVGIRRLENLQQCIEAIEADCVPGDFIETGSYLGGATIFMRAVLKAQGNKDRRVYACDTFVTPAPKISLITKPIIAALASVPSIRWQHTLFQFLQRLPHKHQAFPVAVAPTNDWVRFTMWALRHPAILEGGSPNSLDLVQSYFARFGLLDDQVVFLQGFFSETLADPPFKQLALIRLDGDTYESTRDAIVPLYDLLSPGGFCIVDDYHSFDDCRRAIDEFRGKHKITERLMPIDNLSVYWRKRQ